MVKPKEPAGRPPVPAKRKKQKRYRPKNVFCLEGNWTRDLRNPTTVEGIFLLLNDYTSIKTVFRDVGTIEEFEFYIKRWRYKRYRSYPVLYLAFHGDPGIIHVNHRYTISLEELALLLEHRCPGRIIYFASCGTLDVPMERLVEFCERTGALAVCGYTKEVAWMTSAAFDLILLNAMQEIDFTGRGLPKLYRLINQEAGAMAKRLGFRLAHCGPSACRIFF